MPGDARYIASAQRRREAGRAAAKRERRRKAVTKLRGEWVRRKNAEAAENLVRLKAEYLEREKAA